MTQYSGCGGRCTDALHRRAVLAQGATVASLALAGCLGGSGDDTPAATQIPDGAACDKCGMVISEHPGPNGELFFEDHRPDGHDLPFRFDSLKMCLFPTLLEAEELGHTPTGIYATDYSAVEYTLQTEGETTYISAHTDPASFAAARDLTYVVDSAVEGAMGADFVPFSNGDDATAFADEYGGKTVAYDEIGEGMIGK